MCQSNLQKYCQYKSLDSLKTKIKKYKIWKIFLRKNFGFVERVLSLAIVIMFYRWRRWANLANLNCLLGKTEREIERERERDVRSPWSIVQSLSSASVTRFGEISPLGQNFKILWQVLNGLFSIWQNFEPKFLMLLGKLILL